jgi:hypothetical protein
MRAALAFVVPYGRRGGRPSDGRTAQGRFAAGRRSLTRSGAVSPRAGRVSTRLKPSAWIRPRTSSPRALLERMMVGRSPARRKRSEGESPLADLVQAVRDGAMLEPPSVDEDFATMLDVIEVVARSSRRNRRRCPRTGARAHAPMAAIAASSPGARSTMRKLTAPQVAVGRSSSTAPSLGCSRPVAVSASKTIWPSARTPITMSSENGGGLAVEPHHTTVPSVRYTIGSPASDRAFQAC